MEKVVLNSGRAHCCISKRSTHYSDMTRIGRSCGDIPKITTRSSFFGWLGGFRRNNNINSATTTSLPTPSLQDVVDSYFKQHCIKRYRLTDLQFLNALPGSSNQIWHRDNKFRGLTAIVSLNNIRDNGPTELILGSHKEHFTLFQKCWDVLGEAHGHDSLSDQPLLGCIDAGDTILYDARIFHRGRGNNTQDFSDVKEGEITDRPVLVLRWDATRTPPPGAGLIVTTANKYIGGMLYAALFALQKIAAPFDNEGN